MIETIRRIARRALPCLLIGLASVASAALGDLGPALPARAQIGGIGTPNTYTSVIVTNTIAPQTTNSITGGTLLSQPYTITLNYDLGLEIALLGTNRSDQASNFWTTVNGTLDGTNWMSSPLFTISSKETGTNQFRFFTNFPASTLSSLYQVRLESAGNSDTNPITAGFRFSKAKKPVQPPGLQ